MAWACVLGITAADAGSVSGNLRLDCSIVWTLVNGQKIEYLVPFDFPISGTNWKNVLAAYIRERAISEWGETIAPNDILYCDFSRG